jgi:lysine-N-methylase
MKENGLCEMILTLGEDALCDICREHPRFYHVLSDRDEVGLGLCCEEAARLILSWEGDTVLEVIDDDGEDTTPTAWEETLFSLRERLFVLLQNREKPIHDRAKEMLAFCHAEFPDKTPSEWRDILLSLEQLDPAWRETLESLGVSQDEPLSDLEKPFENLLLYFVYRHTAEATDEQDFSVRVSFAYLGYHIIRLLCAIKKAQTDVCAFQELSELVRRYSSEIEYSEENTEALLNLLRTYT